LATRIGINGFGRIGRQVFKIVQERFAGELEIVAVNDLTDDATLAYLLKYDSIYGQYPGEVSHAAGKIIVDGREITSLAVRNPAELPWKDLGVDIVLESTGIFRDEPKAKMHLDAGAKKVIVSAPGKGNIKTVVFGVNDKTYCAKEHNIVSNASCTTNCLAPMCKVLDETVGIVTGMMTTIHSYTNDQNLLDLPHTDHRRARAAALNIIPTSTGAASAIGEVIPKLKGKMDGLALRVPTPTGSITDLTIVAEKAPCKDTINAAFKAAAEGDLKGILQYNDEAIVLTDIQGNSHSCIFDAPLTVVVGNQVKIFGWYDNEWGFSNRTAELLKKLADEGW
jgi:glyceraldehyde 3-phosphate dehydrogenase